MSKLILPNTWIRIGGLIENGWAKLPQEHELDIQLLQPNSLATFTWPSDYPKPLELKTLFTQEMLKRGYIATPSVYVSYCNTPEIIDTSLEQVNEVFGIIKQTINNDNVAELLESPVCHSGFQRIN